MTGLLKDLMLFEVNRAKKTKKTAEKSPQGQTAAIRS